MGFLDKLLSGIGGGSGRKCPDCGEDLEADGGIRYECHNDACTGRGVYFDEGGTLVDAQNRGKGGGGRTCESCQSSLVGGNSYLPYEDGNNSHAYITCPSCGHENVQYGFGED